MHSGSWVIVVPGGARNAPCTCERTQVEQGRLASLGSEVTSFTFELISLYTISTFINGSNIVHVN